MQSDTTFASYFVGPFNRLAHAAAKAIASTPGAMYSPLYIYGGIGLGKTHLLQAINIHVRNAHPEQTILFLNANEFSDRVTIAAETNSLEAFRNSMLQANILILDNLQHLANKELAQEELIKIFELFFAAKKQLVFACTEAPRMLPDFHNQLVSRLQWGLVVEIEEPDLLSRHALLKEKNNSLHLGIEEDVLAYLAENTFSNMRELEGLATKLRSYVSLLDFKIDMPLAKELSREYMRQTSQTITLQQVQQVICKYFGVKSDLLLSRRRTRSIAFPRQIGMYLAQTLTGASLEEIGRAFGGRDHSTVKHGCEKIRMLSEEDAEIRNTLDQLQKQMLVTC